MQDKSSTPYLLPLAALIFAVAHLVFEHFTGGIRSHHLLNRPDLPAISNGLGLITLPLLGFAAALRVQSHLYTDHWMGLLPAILRAFLGALLYGAVLALSFELGAHAVTSIVFLGLFLCALLLPIYRAEYLLGFVLGMTVTFGAVLPLGVALVFAALSWVTRSTLAWVLGGLRRRMGSS